MPLTDLTPEAELGWARELPLTPVTILPLECDVLGSRGRNQGVHHLLSFNLGDCGCPPKGFLPLGLWQIFLGV